MECDDLAWVVLAGGKGTRSENPDLPKILQDIEGRMVLDFLIDSLELTTQSEVIFVIKHGSEQIVSELQKPGRLPVTPKIVVDTGSGPVAALIEAKSKISASNIGIILGDTVMSAPLKKVANVFVRSSFKSAVVIRQTDHLFDSDSVTVDSNGNITSYSPKSSEKNMRLGQVWGVTGLLFLTTDAVSTLDEDKPDVANAIFSSVCSVADVLALRTSYYFRDSGTPERIAKIRSDYLQQKLIYPRLKNPRSCLFLDRDGTLLQDQPLGRRDLRELDFKPESLDLVRNANMRGCPVILVTNQPAIAKGQITFEDVYYVHNLLQKMLNEKGAKIDDFYFCPHHPDKGFLGEVAHLKVECNCRKPATGLFMTAAEEHNLLLGQGSTLLGDSVADLMAAERLGLTFIDVKDLA